MCYIGLERGPQRPPSNPQQKPMPRRRSAPTRPAIAHARVSAAELAAWQDKAAAVGVSLAAQLRQALAYWRHT